MQLDRTRIAVRERGGVDILDMSLHVVRQYFRHVIWAAIAGALPFAIINAALLYGAADNPDGDFPYRYAWLMIVLVFVESQLATAFITTFLGSAVFDEKTNVRQAIRETLRRLPQLLWCQGVMRGALVAIGIVLLARFTGDDEYVLETMLLIGLVIYVMIVRSFRPFINEIVLLERNPLRAKNATMITAGKRSKYLHQPSGSDLALRWMGSAAVASLLSLAIIECLAVAQGVFLGDWEWGWFMLHLSIPAALWLIAAYMAVVRFLNYLDLRIRHEGWEVELRLRAEAVRLTSKLT
jgi:hypothetical protein